jgi:hypothetical protein
MVTAEARTRRPARRRPVTVSLVTGVMVDSYPDHP